MALDNKLRVSELVQSGSRAIISEDPISKTHTFIDGGTTIVSKSSVEPYEHIEGERDGELTNYIEKPKYDETQLKKAVDTVIDELIVPPPPPSPPVVPKPVYDDLLERYNQAISDLAAANDTIRNLQAQVSQLQGEIRSLRQQLDAAQVARAIAENQLQQQASSFGELSSKFSQAIIKGTKEASARVSLQAQVEGLTAQKDTLREQILQLRQIVASLQGQVAAQLDILDAQISSAKATEDALNEQINQAEAANLVEQVDDLGPDAYKIFDGGLVAIYIDVANDSTRLGKPGNWDDSRGMIRWVNQKSSPKNHLSGANGGNSATLKIKSISTTPVTVELVGSTKLKEGSNARTGNKRAQNLDTRSGYIGPFKVSKKSWSVPAAQETDGVVKSAVQGPNIIVGEAADIHAKKTGDKDGGGNGYYTFRLKETGATVQVPWSAIQKQAGKK